MVVRYTTELVHKADNIKAYKERAINTGDGTGAGQHGGVRWVKITDKEKPSNGNLCIVQVLIEGHPGEMIEQYFVGCWFSQKGFEFLTDDEDFEIVQWAKFNEPERS